MEEEVESDGEEEDGEAVQIVEVIPSADLCADDESAREEDKEHCAESEESNPMPVFVVVKMGEEEEEERCRHQQAGREDAPRIERTWKEAIPKQVLNEGGVEHRGVDVREVHVPETRGVGSGETEDGVQRGRDEVANEGFVGRDFEQIKCDRKHGRDGKPVDAADARPKRGDEEGENRWKRFVRMIERKNGNCGGEQIKVDRTLQKKKRAPQEEGEP